MTHGHISLKHHHWSLLGCKIPWISKIPQPTRWRVGCGILPDNMRMITSNYMAGPFGRSYNLATKHLVDRGRNYMTDKTRWHYLFTGVLARKMSILLWTQCHLLIAGRVWNLFQHHENWPASIIADNGLSPDRRQVVNWTLRNKLKWNFNRNHNIFIQENAFESVVWKIATILCLT